MADDVDLSWALRWPGKCCTGVTRQGELEPCDKPACAVIIGDDDGQPCAWPVCPAHTRVGHMVPLDTLLAVRT